MKNKSSMKMKRDFTPWLLLPGIVLTLSGVTLLAPHQAAHADPPVPVQAAPKADATYDDGDGDELLEHWGDAKYAQEARRQMTGMAGGFVVLGALASRRRFRCLPPGAAVPLPSEADFLKLDSGTQSPLGAVAQPPLEAIIQREHASETQPRKAA